MPKKFAEEDFIISTTHVFEEQVIFCRSHSSGAITNANIVNPISWHSGSTSGSLYSIVYDRPATQTNASKLYSFTFGYTTGSAHYTGSFNTTNRAEKIKVYQLFAKKLLGEKKSQFYWNGKTQNDVIFFCLYRNLYKDGISTEKLHQFASEFLGIPSGAFGPNGSITPNRAGLLEKTKEFPGGRAVFLKNEVGPALAAKKEVGLLFPRQGIFVLEPELFGTGSENGNNWSGSATYQDLVRGTNGSTFSNLLYAIRYRLWSVNWKSTSNIKTTFYKCTAEPDEFNYSANTSFTNNQTGEIFTNSGSQANLTPTTYITSVGLLGRNDELIAVGKTSRPIKKDKNTRVIVRVRLDY